MVLLALISCAVFAVSSATVHGCITPFCSYSFLNVCGITSHSGLNIPGDGGRQCICLGFFFCCWKGWKFACKPNCMAGDYKTFSFQIWFSPLWIFLSCSKARFILTSPDWGGAHNHSGKCPVAWKSGWLEGERFSGAVRVFSVLTPSPFIQALVGCGDSMDLSLGV